MRPCVPSVRTCLLALAALSMGLAVPCLAQQADEPRIELRLVTQLRYTWSQPDEGDPSTEVLEVRRNRLWFRGALPAQGLTFGLQLNAVPRQLELLDVFTEVALPHDVNIRVGQWKIPFTRYRQNSFTTLRFAEWSLVSPWFGSERQLGVAVSNDHAGQTGLEYQVGIFSGLNARRSHGIGAALLSGEPRPNRSDLVNGSPVDDLHPEVVGHLSWSSDGAPVRDWAAEPEDGLQYSVGVSTAWDLDPNIGQDATGRAAVEANAWWGPIWGVVIGYGSWIDTSGSAGPLGLLPGALLEAGVRLPARTSISARAASARATPGLRRALADTGWASSGLLGQQEAAVALSWDPIAAYLRLQTDVTALRTLRLQDDRMTWLWRFQVQTTF